MTESTAAHAAAGHAVAAAESNPTEFPSFFEVFGVDMHGDFLGISMHDWVPIVMSWLVVIVVVLVTFYYQGLLVEIGNLKGFQTFIPYQDKNKFYLSQILVKYATLERFYGFTYAHIVKRAITIDVTWFNERNGERQLELHSDDN